MEWIPCRKQPKTLWRSRYPFQTQVWNGYVHHFDQNPGIRSLGVGVHPKLGRGLGVRFATGLGVGVYPKPGRGLGIGVYA